MPLAITTWIEATRPKTLTAALVPVVVGTALAWATGHSVRPGLATFALLSALCIQIGTNFINDAIDFRKGTDNEDRIGPRRVTAAGLMRAETVMVGGFSFFFLAALFAVPLLRQGGWPILTIGVFSLFCGYAYTGGPFPLAYVGLGEIFVLLFFGLVAVLGVFFLQTDRIGWEPLLGGTQIGFLATALIAINNLRDARGDRESGKRTLAVRFGLTFGRAEIATLCLAPFVAGALWWIAGYRLAALLPLLALPLATRLARDVARTEPSPKYNAFLARSAGLHLVFGALLSLGFFLGAR
jgi:1,4-dihydroxy-2-naphthoate octaprenyltransferase